MVTSGDRAASWNGSSAAPLRQPRDRRLRLGDVDDPGRNDEIDIEAPPRPGEQRIPRRGLRRDQPGGWSAR